MEIKIEVAADRSLKVSSEHFGTVGEDNATILNFVFDTKIPTGAKVLIFSNRKGSFRKDLIENTYKAPIDITLNDYLDMQVEVSGEELLWYSDVYRFKLGKSINHKEENSLQIVKEKAVEEFSKEIEELIDASGVIEYDESFG